MKMKIFSKQTADTAFFYLKKHDNVGKMASNID